MIELENSLSQSTCPIDLNLSRYSVIIYNTYFLTFVIDQFCFYFRPQLLTKIWYVCIVKMRTNPKPFIGSLNS